MRSDGTIVAWGYNLYGQLGDGTTTDRSSPVTISGLGAVSKISGGTFHGLALRTNGTVAAWGYNVYGQLGNGTTTDSLTPVTVSGLSGVVKLDASRYSSNAITSTGDLYTWGYNSFGNLGDNSTNNYRTTPVLAQGFLDLNSTPLATTFAYAADGMRTNKTTGDIPTTFVWDRTSPIAPLLTETSGNATTSYLYGPDATPYASIDAAGVVTYLHHDRLGSTRVATSTGGTVVGTATYDPYGKPAGTTGNMPNIGWAGQYRDTETGLAYLRARYYDPATAQFLTRDPMAESTREAYGYVGGNPLNRTDPSGLFWGQGTLSNIGSAVGDAASSTQAYLRDHRQGIQQALIATSVIAATGALLVATGGSGALLLPTVLGNVALGAGLASTAVTCLTESAGNCTRSVAVAGFSAGVGKGLAWFGSSQLARIRLDSASGLFISLFQAGAGHYFDGFNPFSDFNWTLASARFGAISC